MRITVFGATGRTGRLLIEQALASGYQVVAFARNPSKLNTNKQFLRQIRTPIGSAFLTDKPTHFIDKLKNKPDSASK